MALLSSNHNISKYVNSVCVNSNLFVNLDIECDSNDFVQENRIFVTTVCNSRDFILEEVIERLVDYKAAPSEVVQKAGNQQEGFQRGRRHRIGHDGRN